VAWNDDWPVIGQPIPGKDSGQPVASFAMPETGHAPTDDRLQDSDEFSSSALGLQWSWNHNPLDERLEPRRAAGLAAARGAAGAASGDRAQHADAGPAGAAADYTARLDVGGMAEGSAPA
jgi:beta-xylosidase